VALGRAKMQKTVTPSHTRSTGSETDGHGAVITVVLCCGKSVVKLTILGGVSISHAPCLPCHLDLIDTMFKPLYVDVILPYHSFSCQEPTADNERHRNWQLASHVLNGFNFSFIFATLF